MKEFEVLSPYSKLRNPNRKPLHEQLPLKSPFFLHIETTGTCNFSCKMCARSDEDYMQKIGGMSSLSPEDVRKIYASILQIGKIKVLRLYGTNEPFLDKNIFSHIKLAKEMNVTDRIEITSNCSAMTSKISDQILDSGLDYLRISIYGAGEAVHKEITTSSIPAEKILNNIKYLREKRDSLGLKRPFIYAKVIDFGDKEDNDLFLRNYTGIADEVCLEEVFNWGREGDVHLITDTPVHLSKEVCPLPFMGLMIQSNGDVVACCVDWAKDTLLGNIHHESFDKIWNGEALKKFKMMHLERRRGENKACKDCTYLNLNPDNLDNIPKEDFHKII